MGVAWSSLAGTTADPQQPAPNGVSSKDQTPPSTSASQSLPPKNSHKSTPKSQGARVGKAAAARKNGVSGRMAQTRRSRAAASKADPAGQSQTATKDDASDVATTSDGTDASPVPDATNNAGPTTSKPLKGCAIALSGNFSSVGHNLPSMKLLVKELGGMVPSSITQSTTHIVCPANMISRKSSTSVSMKIPIIKPEWITDCEAKKQRLPESDYLQTYSINVNGQPHTGADVLADAIAGGLIISPSNGDATTSTNTAKRGRNAAADDEVKVEDEDEKDDEKPKAKKAKTAPKASKGKAAAKNEPAPAQAVPAPVDGDAEDGDLAVGQFAKKKSMVIPIDEFCTLAGYQVYIDQDSGMIYDASLNQSNASNNNNKFYRDQVCGPG